MRSLVLLAILAPLSAGAAAPPAGWPEIQTSTAVTGLKMGYQLVVADLNRDGRPDLIPVDERSAELAWYENPTWQRHVLAVDVPRTINLDVFDYDGDGMPEIALGHNFETVPAKSTGNLLLLKSGPDPRRPWTAREIDRIPTIHRIRWIDWRGDGKKVLLVAPLVGARGLAPDYADHVPVYLYRPGVWKREVFTEVPYGVLHSIVPVPWDGRGERLLTADFQGIRLFTADGRSTLLSPGDPRPCPQCGSSEIRVGRAAKQRFVAAIEPWHGNQVVVYRGRAPHLQREVLEEGMLNGHALAVGDLDGDGHDEIVAGFRGKGFQLYCFRLEKGRWVKRVLDDGGMAAADCKFLGPQTLACNGATTGNVKIYSRK